MRPQVQVWVGNETRIPTGLSAALARLNASVSFGALDAIARDGASRTAEAFVLLAPAARGPADVERAVARLTDQGRSTLVLGGEPGARLRLSQGSGAVSFSSGTNSDEVALRLRTMIEVRRASDSRAGVARAGAIQRRILDRGRAQIRLTAGLGQEVRTPALPRIGPLEFELLSRCAEEVGGDMVDIQRLDEHRVLVTLSDAEGHGVAAARLNLRLRRALNAAAATGDPGLILSRINTALFEDEENDGAFATVVCALFDLRTRTCVLARGGAPYPILRHADGGLELLNGDGPLVGVLPSARFPVRHMTLVPGDELLLYSDGLEVVTAANAPVEAAAALAEEPASVARRLAGQSVRAAACPGAPGEFEARGADAPRDALEHLPADRRIEGTGWYTRLRTGGLAAAMKQAGVRHDLLRRLGRGVDDMTLLAIRVR